MSSFVCVIIYPVIERVNQVLNVSPERYMNMQFVTLLLFILLFLCISSLISFGFNAQYSPHWSRIITCTYRDYAWSNYELLITWQLYGKLCGSQNKISDWKRENLFNSRRINTEKIQLIVHQDSSIGSKQIHWQNVIQKNHLKNSIPMVVVASCFKAALFIQNWYFGKGGGSHK